MDIGGTTHDDAAAGPTLDGDVLDPIAALPTESHHRDDRWPPPSYWAQVGLILAVLVGLVWAVVTTAEILLLILVSMVLAIGLQRPLVWLERHHVRRGLALGLMIGGVLVVVGGFLALVVPSVVRELEGLARKAPDYVNRYRNRGWVRDLDRRFDLTDHLEKLGSGLPDQVVTFGRGLVSAVIASLTVLVLTLYFASDLPRITNAFGRLLLPRHREKFDAIVVEVTRRVGGYVNGNLIVSVIAGLVTFVGLLIIGVPFAAALAFWVALTDLIPTIGALMGATVVLVVAGFTSPGALIASGILMLVYQQVENYLIVPRVMKGAINMSVGSVLIAVLIGSELAGFIGVLLALPIAATLRAVVDELYLDERRQTVLANDLRQRRRRWWRNRIEGDPA